VLIPRKGSFFHFHYIFITLVTLLQNPIACRCNTDSHQNTTTIHTITTAGLCWGAHSNPKCDSEATSIGPQYQAGNGRDGVYSQKGTSFFYYIAFAKIPLVPLCGRSPVPIGTRAIISSKYSTQSPVDIGKNKTLFFTILLKWM